MDMQLSLDLPVIELERLIHSSRGYLSQYGALLELGKDVKRPFEIQALALAVYGWMLTILQSVEITAEEIQLAREVDEKNRRAQFISRFKAAPINASWVGSSKFLHFINPYQFAIWDSHIARAFGIEKRHQYERADVYRDYLDSLELVVSENTDKIAEVSDMVGIQFGYQMTNLRAAEFLIFVSSRDARRALRETPRIL